MCTTKVLESELFDIVLTRSNNYQYEHRYVLRYGLQVTHHEYMVDAVKAFNDALQHALACEGYVVIEES